MTEIVQALQDTPAACVESIRWRHREAYVLMRPNPMHPGIWQQGTIQWCDTTAVTRLIRLQVLRVTDIANYRLSDKWQESSIIRELIIDA